MTGKNNYQPPCNMTEPDQGHKCSMRPSNGYCDKRYIEQLDNME